MLLPALKIYLVYAVLSPHPLSSLGTAIHDVLPTHSAFLPLFSAPAVSVSVVRLACPCPTPLSLLRQGFILRRAGCRAGLGLEGGRGVQELQEDPLFCQLCGGVREGRGKDEEAMTGREEPSPFYQRREREALP